jgi:hypothetical protein
MLGKSLRSFESWVIGTAVGINFLPVLDFVGAFFTDNAGLLWELVIIAISALNLVCLLALARKRTMNSGPTRLPVFPILVFVLGYLGLFLFQRFYRDSGHGLYAFNIFFGGDMGWLGSDVLCLEKHTKLAEWGFGGMPIYYHDFVFRALAGLHRYSGGNYIDALWYFQTPFDFLLLVLMIWLLVKRLTSQNVMAWIAVVVFFLGRRLWLLFLNNSASGQLGIVEGLAALYLLIEMSRADDRSIRINASLLYLALLACFAGWKLTLVMVLEPALLLTGLVRGMREGKWGFFYLTLLGTMLSGLFFTYVYLHAGGYSGQDVVGRPLWPLAEFVNHHFSLSLQPVMTLHSPTMHGLLSFAVLLLPYAAFIIMSFGRFAATVFVFPRREYHEYTLPYSGLFFLTVLVIGAFFDIFISPQHYFNADPYQIVYAHLLLSIPFGIVIGHLWLNRSHVKVRVTPRPAIALVVIAIFLEIFRGYFGFGALASETTASVPVSLLEELDSAAAKLPEHSLVATRRFNLSSGLAADTLSQDHPLTADWNFEFYAAGLRSPVVLEGPEDGFLGGCASVKIDTTLLENPDPTLSNYLWRSSTLLNALYDSHSETTARTAVDSLHITHILIDKTIGQQLASSVAAGFDTIYAGKSIVLLKVKK